MIESRKYRIQRARLNRFQQSILGTTPLWTLFVIGVYFIGVYKPNIYVLSIYKVYYQSAQALINGTALYNGVTGWIYLYPPLLAQLAQILMPIVRLLDYRIAAIVWFAVNALLLFGVVALLTRYIPPSWKKLIWVATVLFIPIMHALFIGQVTIILLALIVGVWIAIRKDFPFIAGLLLALAAWIKIFPAFVILYFIWKRNGSVIAGTALAGATLALIQIIISGPAIFLSFFEVLFNLAAFGQPEGVYESYSILAFASRLFQEHNHVAPLFKSETLYTISRFLLTGGALLVAYYSTIPSGRHQRGETLSWRFDLEYSLIVFTSLLVGSTLWISGLPPLLLFYVLTLRHQHRFDNPQTIRFICLLSYALIMMNIPLVLIATATKARVSALILSLGFFGAILLWGLIVVLLRQSDEALAVNVSRPKPRRAGFSYRP